MDYESIHGPGISNFSSPHRMPTVSAAQALQDLNSSPTRCISTGLPLLDYALQNRDPVTGDTEPFLGGVSRGKVTEIYGPPGVGKTTLCIQLVGNALVSGESVVWVDGSYQVSGRRISQILSSIKPSTSSDGQDESSPQNLYENFIHFSTPSLAHFIAFFSTLTPTHPPTNTSLIIIDSFSTLIACAFPRNADSNAAPRKPGEPNPSARKFAILQNQINALNKLAASRNIAIVILSQCATKMRSGACAALVPALNMKAWEQGLACRIALFKDFGWEDEQGNDVQDVRFAQILKAEGNLVPEGRSKVVAFSILESGLAPVALPIMPISTPDFRSPMKRSPHPLSLSHSQPADSTPNLPVLPQKRKFQETGFEIPDSDDEDYGWEEDDEEELPPPPPQWQGSEDVLGPGMELEEEEAFEKDDELDELAGDPSPEDEADENVGQERDQGARRSSGGRISRLLPSPTRHDTRGRPHWSSRAQSSSDGGAHMVEPEDVGGFEEPPIDLPHRASYERDREKDLETLARIVPELIPDSDSEDELAA